MDKYELLIKLLMENPLPHIYGKLEYLPENGYARIHVYSANKSYARLVGWEEKNLLTLNQTIEFREGIDQQYIEQLMHKGEHEVYSYVSQLNRWYKVRTYKFEDDFVAVCFEEDHKLGKQTEMLISHMPIPAWCTDEHGRYIAVSQKYAQCMRLDPEALIGNSIYSIYDDETVQLIRGRDRVVSETLKPHKYKCYGDQFFGYGCCEYTKIPCINKEGKYIGLVGYAEDISYKHSYEWVQDEKEKIFKEISQHMNDVVIISVPSESDNGKVVYVSPSFSELFGVEEDSLYDSRLNILPYIGEEYRSIIADRAYDRILDETMQIQRGDGELRWVWFRSIPIKDFNGSVIRRIAVFSDITEKQNKEKELEQLRMEFFANISHEFRTPINLISSSLTMLTRKLEELPEDTRNYYSKYMGIMKQNQSRLLKLVNNLIDCTKIDAGYMGYKPENYDIVYFTESICQSVVSFAQQKMIAVYFDTNVEEYMLSFDLDKMETILLNLLSNGIKYNRPNGSIVVTVDVSEDEVMIKVEDSGIGIPDSKKDVVFGRFQQVDSIWTQYGEGSGIGLSLVKALVEMHGGRVELESKVNVGSVFTIVLPNKQESQQSFGCVPREEVILKKMEIEFSDIEL